MARGRPLSDTKVFDGEKYEFYGTRETKDMAQKTADWFRKQGVNARIVRTRRGGHGAYYIVYTHYVHPSLRGGNKHGK